MDCIKILVHPTSIYNLIRRRNMNEISTKSEIQRYLNELIRRNVISRESLKDWMLNNYLCDCKIDVDFFQSKLMNKNSF